MKKLTATALVLLALAAAACAKPSREIRFTVRECEKQDGVKPVEVKNPRLAAGLGVLFGGGSFYTRKYKRGALDALTWPLSILWDPLLGYWGARALNDQATLEACREARERRRAELAASPAAPAGEQPKP